MTKIKIYTEEEALKGIVLARLHEYSHSQEELLGLLTPMELPSDEEIVEMGKDVIIYNDTKRGWFIQGLKFMRDKIQGG